MDNKKNIKFSKYKKVTTNSANDTQNDGKSDYKKSRYKIFKSYVSSLNIPSIFGYVVLILVSSMLIRFLYTGSFTTITLRGLLELFKNSPQVSPSIKNFFGSLTIVGNWGIFEGLRYFLNNFVQFFGIITWMSSSLFDVIIFIIYFLSWLFY